jgi:Mrp family chromosome partitioning ATPase
MLIVDSGHSRRTVVRQAREALATAGAHVLGAVLNRSPARARGDESNYGGYYDPRESVDKRPQGTEASPTGRTG